MKKNLIIFTLISLLLAPTVGLLGAEIAEPNVDNPPITNLQQMVDLIEQVAKWIYAIVFALAIIFILIAAFQFLTAGGNPDTIAKARQNIIYALVAIAIAIIAWGLPKLVEALLVS